MRISPGTIIRKVYGTVRRFPLAVAAVVTGAVIVLLAIHGFEDEIDYRWVIFLPVALLTSVAGRLAVEERRSRAVGLIAELGVPLLWGVRCLFLPDGSNELTTPQWVEIGVVTGVSFLAAFVTPFLRRDTDAQWWNFSARVVARLAWGALFSGILFGGFLLAIHAVAELFSVDPPDELFGWLAVGCFIVFAPLYVMAGIPSGEAKHDPELHPLPELKVFALYILGPILAVYTLILYVYLLKIVFTWELPNGWVSWLVTVLAVGGLVVTLLLYPLRMSGGNRAAELLGRWTGVLIVPLLMLMTVGIARRISDYGFTPNRCYILLLNLCFYAIYGWLFVVRGRRVKWILISAAAVALLSSVGPWSLARVTPRPSDPSELPEAERETEESSDWFSSDSVIVANTPTPLDHGHTRFMKIYWFRSPEYESEGVAIIEREDHLAVRPAGKEGPEFVLPFEAVASRSVIRGEGFVFIVSNCYGLRYPDIDEIEVNHLEGFLFYD